MTKAIALKGKIIQITRKMGKSEAVMQISIPAEKSSEIPLTEVNITLEETQSSLPLNVQPKPLRGDKG